MGETENRPFQLSFNSSLKIDFQGSRVTSDGGLVLVRELDERLGLGELIERHLADARGKNTQLPWPICRGSRYMAGGGLQRPERRGAAVPRSHIWACRVAEDLGAWRTSTSRLQSFETTLLTQAYNLAGLPTLNRELVGTAETIDPLRRVVLDMDSTEIPVDGQYEQSAYNGGKFSLTDREHRDKCLITRSKKAPVSGALANGRQSWSVET